MNLKSLQEKENKLLDRKECLFEATFDSSTPKESEVKKSIAAAGKVSEDLIAIKKIAQGYGIKKARISAHIYRSQEQLKRVESIKEKKKEEKPAETKAPKENKE